MNLQTYIIGVESVGLTSHRESATECLLKMDARDVDHVLETLKDEYEWGDYERGGFDLDKWYFPLDQTIVSIELLEDINEL
jgi:hypothetical protein